MHANTPTNLLDLESSAYHRLPFHVIPTLCNAPTLHSFCDVSTHPCGINIISHWNMHTHSPLHPIVLSSLWSLKRAPLISSRIEYLWQLNIHLSLPSHHPLHVSSSPLVHVTLTCLSFSTQSWGCFLNDFHKVFHSFLLGQLYFHISPLLRSIALSFTNHYVPCHHKV